MTRPRIIDVVLGLTLATAARADVVTPADTACDGKGTGDACTYVPELDAGPAQCGTCDFHCRWPGAPVQDAGFDCFALDETACATTSPCLVRHACNDGVVECGADAGPAPVDGGVPPVADAGTPPVDDDAGAPPDDDAGAVTADDDAGAADGPDGGDAINPANEGGCACAHAAPARHPFPGLAVFAVGLAVVAIGAAWRRRTP